MMAPPFLSNRVAYVLARVAVKRVSIACDDLRSVDGIERDEVVQGQIVGILDIAITHEADPVLVGGARHMDDGRLASCDIVIGFAEQRLVGAERSELGVSSAPAGPGAASASVSRMRVGGSVYDRISVRA